MFSLLKSVFGRRQNPEPVSKSSNPPAALSQSDTAAASETLSQRAHDEFIELPLKTVISRFPENFQAQLRKPLGRAVQVALPLSMVLAPETIAWPRIGADRMVAGRAYMD
jgi:hypothetical protein